MNASEGDGQGGGRTDLHSTRAWLIRASVAALVVSVIVVGCGGAPTNGPSGSSGYIVENGSALATDILRQYPRSTRMVWYDDGREQESASWTNASGQFCTARVGFDIDPQGDGSSWQPSKVTTVPYCRVLVNGSDLAADIRAQFPGASHIVTADDGNEHEAASWVTADGRTCSAQVGLDVSPDGGSWHPSRVITVPYCRGIDH